MAHFEPVPGFSLWPPWVGDLPSGEALAPWIAGDLELDESHVVISGLQSRLQAVRVEEPLAMQPLAPIDDAGGRLALDGDRLLVAHPGNGLGRSRFDTDLVSGLDLVASLELETATHDVALAGFAASSGGAGDPSGDVCLMDPDCRSRNEGTA